MTTMNSNEREERQDAPERVFLKACHPASPNQNCSWIISKTAEESVEYVRANPLDRQVAVNAVSRNDVVARIEKQIRLWNSDTVTMACADMLADIKQLPVVDATAATRMREACVGELQLLLETEVNGHCRGAYNRAITALESLTLDQVEQKQS